MSNVTFQYPADFYGDNVTIEDWLVNFSAHTETIHIETSSPAGSNPAETVSAARFSTTALGDLAITREMLVAIFGAEAVAKQELDATIAYLENRAL